MPCHSSPLLLALAALPVRLAAAGPLAPDFDAFFGAIRQANLALAAAGEAPSSVKVAPQWSADVLYDSVMVGMNFTNGVGIFAYDSIGQRYRNIAEARSDIFFPTGTQYLDQLSKNITGAPNQNMTIGKAGNGVCLPVKGAYFDIFSWTVGARYNGSKVLNGEACDIWEQDKVIPSLIGKDQLTHFSACIAADGVPREFTQAFHSVKVSAVQTYRFRNIKIGDPGDEVFKNSPACAENYPGKPCEDQGVKTINIYRIWAPPEPLELQNRNTGDTMGDLSFLCTQAAGDAYKSKLVTVWSVEVSSSYGQYALCNYDGHRNKCGGDPQMLKRVGRRASQMQGDRAACGQCTENDDIGSQYSFPSEALCPEGTSPSASGCAWASPKPVRTVRVACVLEHGLLETCGREFGHAPFSRSIEIFEAALASNDTSKGGCPDALPTTSTSRTTAIII